jgi:APA family basic amino acid/polyamine antiporter
MNTPSTGSARQLGFWMCVALVVGNIIGSGIFLLPASLAPYGLNSLWAWLLTCSGAVVLAMVFAGLGRAFPDAGGPYAYTRMAFGDLAAFIVIWVYWISLWIGNAAIATGAVSYLSNLVPWIADKPSNSAAVTVFFVWLLTAVNVYGARSAGKLQIVTTLLKLAPLLGIAGLGVYLALTGSSQLHNAHLATHFSMNAVTAAATLTLFALCGLESASVAADKVKDPARTIPRATIAGTVLSAVIYILASTAVLLLIPGDKLAHSNAPFADVASMFWGGSAAHWLALFAAISGLGALNGWILLAGELPFQMAKGGLFPKIFAAESPRHTPTFALCFTSMLVTVLVLMNYGKTMVEVFTFLVLLSTTATLVMYLVCALAVLKLLRSGAIGASKSSGWLAIAGVVGAIFALWAIAGAGISTDSKLCGGALICWAPWQQNPVILGFALLALAVPVFYLMRLSRVVPRTVSE